MFVLIAGAGALGREVAKALSDLRHDVIVVDISKAVCESVYAELGVVAVHGSATDLHVLEEAGARRADVVVALMHSDAENITTALLAHSVGVSRILARLRDPGYEAAYREAGVTHVVRSTRLLRNQIVLHVQHADVRQIVNLGDHDVEMFSVEVPAGSPCAGQTIREIAARSGFPHEALVAGIVGAKDGGFTIPRGDHVIRAGDTVYLLARGDDVDRLVTLMTKG